jgi:hypothetical protein
MPWFEVAVPLVRLTSSPPMTPVSERPVITAAFVVPA